MIQPFLFSEMEQLPTTPALDKKKVGVSVINRLLCVRRNLTAEEQIYEGYISKTIKEIRSCATLSFSQKEQLVLISIEKQQARLTEEIAGDTRLSQVEVKEIVRELVKKGVLRLVERYVPNSPRKHYFIKSNRIKDVEGD